MDKSIPFDFVFDYLPTGITVKKMFGMHYIYLGKRIMLILRRRDNESDLNGIWVATSKEHHQSLKNDIQELGAFFINGDERHGNWLLIQDNSEDFENAAIKVCELISHYDTRIGNLTEKAPL
ncbi:MAG: hypothetical protein JWQ63_4120 [Mucilaginibacter sp.]|jgi:hypothetical protein|nr:hypothetical protein [Mucilaginibacter sp.]